MKFNMKAILLISLVFAVSISSISCVALSAVDSIYTAQEKEFYSNKDNFENVNGVFDRLEKYKGNYYIYLKNIDSDRYFRELRFRVSNTNFAYLDDSGFFDEVHNGDSVTICLAYDYFGDGYVIPVVAVSANGKDYLDFENGWQALMSEYS